jgi:hypothetical protein
VLPDGQGHVLRLEQVVPERRHEGLLFCVVLLMCFICG